MNSSKKDFGNVMKTPSILPQSSKTGFDIDNSEKNILQLKIAALNGIVVKGLKETLKSIESQKAKVVYLALDCELEDYTRIVKEYCTLFKRNLVEVQNWMELRNILMNKPPSSYLELKAKRNGKIAKIGPKCYCAAILDYGDYKFN